MSNTQDLVQDTLFQAFRRIDRFESRGEGALQAYLRKAVLNRMRNFAREAAPQQSRAGYAGKR
jgi:DNA-directed RNA polymerase specialized sigma24 family protein